MRISLSAHRLIKADADKQRSAEASEPVDRDDLAGTRRSVREYIDTLDEAAWGAASDAKPKFVSRSDPATQWTGAQGGRLFAYATNYLIDLDHAVIVDVGASRAIQQAEVGSAHTMLDRTQERFSLWPARLAGSPARKILRSIHEGARDMARDIVQTDGYVVSRREPKKVELLFAHVKRILRVDRLRLRGPNGARDEFQRQPRTSGKSPSFYRTGRRSGPRDRRKHSPANRRPWSPRSQIDFFNDIRQKQNKDNAAFAFSVGLFQTIDAQVQLDWTPRHDLEAVASDLDIALERADALRSGRKSGVNGAAAWDDHRPLQDPA